jgi:uncharacterized protein YjbJ (UPF0337 family)
MIFMRNVRRIALATLAVALTTMMTLGLGVGKTWAATAFSSPSSPANLAVTGRVEAAAKDIEGKTQEAVGRVTGDRQDQLMGQAKQVESQARSAVEDVKDGIDGVSERAKAASDIVEGKAQEAMGNVTGDRQDQFMGQAKQAQGEARNVVEDVKDRIQDLFN